MAATGTPAPGGRPHLVVVEAYDGVAELLSSDPAEVAAARGLGLPLDELAGALDARMTVLGWDEWLAWERTGRSFVSWMPTPATRPRSITARPIDVRRDSDRVKYAAIAARDIDHGESMPTRGLSARSHGLLASSDPLFLMACCLERALRDLVVRDPFDAVIVPMWTGCGYIAQIARATGAPGALDVPFAVVVTDISSDRHDANEEGHWTRAAATRRQMEDLSLALADLVLAFGPRGAAIATAGRLPGAPPPVVTARRVERAVLRAIADAADTAARAVCARHRTDGTPLQFFLAEPQDSASGALVALDAVALLNRRGLRLSRPLLSGGPDMVFAPMKPRSFVDYWRSRGFVRDLIAAGQWSAATRTDGGDVEAVRLYPSAFEHLPDVWSELARGRLVILSPAAAEGLAPHATLPDAALIDGTPTPQTLAAAIARVSALPACAREAARRQLCRLVVEAHTGAGRTRRLDATVAALRTMLVAAPARQDLSQVARLLLDRPRALRDLAAAEHPGSPPAGNGRLSVVIPCHEAGALLVATVASVWTSSRPPEEVLVVDDGSRGDATREAIVRLEQCARRDAHPLRVIRQDNRGLAAARNTGLGAATSEFVSFIDADDLVEPAFYGVAVALLERYPALGGVAGWALCFGDGVPDGFWNPPQPELPLLLVENTVIVPCVVRTDTLRRLGGYDVDQRYNYEDWELSVRLLATGHPIVALPRYVQRYRVRGDSLLRTMTDTQHQVMRERFLGRHRDVVSRFGVEVVMYLEQRLARALHAAPPAQASAVIGDSPRGALRRVVRRVRRALTVPA